MPECGRRLLKTQAGADDQKYWIDGIGYTLSSEEFGPNELVQFATQAETSGFDFLTVSDHFHRWTETQGQSSFVWSTLAAPSQRTGRIPIGTGDMPDSVRGPDQQAFVDLWDRELANAVASWRTSSN